MAQRLERGAPARAEGEPAGVAARRDEALTIFFGVRVFFAIVLAQTAILTVSVLQARQPPNDALVLGDPVLEVLVAVASTGLVAVGLGIVVAF